MYKQTDWPSIPFSKQQHHDRTVQVRASLLHVNRLHWVCFMQYEVLPPGKLKFTPVPQRSQRAVTFEMPTSEQPKRHTEFVDSMGIATAGVITMPMFQEGLRPIQNAGRPWICQTSPNLPYIGLFRKSRLCLQVFTVQVQLICRRSTSSLGSCEPILFQDDWPN